MPFDVVDRYGSSQASPILVSESHFGWLTDGGFGAVGPHHNRSEKSEKLIIPFIRLCHRNYARYIRDPVVKDL